MGKKFSCLAILATIAVVMMATMNITMAANDDEQLATSPAAGGNSKLTQEKFLDMLHAIVMHGYLADEPFIEKTLQTKLNLQDMTGVPMRGPDQRSYSANTILGGGFGVQFVDEKGETQALKRKGHVSFNFAYEGDHQSFQNCKALKKEQFDKAFGGNFIEHIAQNHQKNMFGGDGGACKVLAAVGGYPPMQLNYSFDTDDGTITWLQLSQSTSMRYCN